MRTIEDFKKQIEKIKPKYISGNEIYLINEETLKSVLNFPHFKYETDFHFSFMFNSKFIFLSSLEDNIKIRCEVVKEWGENIL